MDIIEQHDFRIFGYLTWVNFENARSQPKYYKLLIFPCFWFLFYMEKYSAHGKFSIQRDQFIFGKTRIHFDAKEVVFLNIFGCRSFYIKTSTGAQ